MSSVILNYIHCLIIEETLVVMENLKAGNTLIAFSMSQLDLKYMFKTIYF